MFLKSFSLISSIGVFAVAPFVSLNPNKLQSSSQNLIVDQKNQNDFRNNKNPSLDFFNKYFEQINKSIAACKTDNSIPCPSLFYLEDKATHEEAILQVVNPTSSKSKDVETHNSSDSGSNATSSDSLMENKENISDILPEWLKEKASYLRKISSINLLDFDKLSINFFDGKEKIISFNISEQFENFSKLRNDCGENVKQKNNLMCSALDAENDVSSDTRQVIYR